MLSKSSQRHTFQAEPSLKTLEKDPDNEEAQNMVEWYAEMKVAAELREQGPEWQKDNMEYDLRTTDWILEKARSDEVYAQHLYAAMCNVDFVKNAVWPVLLDQRWACSWRHAGGIIADMRQEGDYIDWYCSGMRGEDITDDAFKALTPPQQEQYMTNRAFVGEGVVTDEIRADLLKLGWVVKDDYTDIV